MFMQSIASSADLSLLCYNLSRKIFACRPRFKMTAATPSRELIDGKHSLSLTTRDVTR